MWNNQVELLSLTSCHFEFLVFGYFLTSGCSFASMFNYLNLTVFKVDQEINPTTGEFSDPHISGGQLCITGLQFVFLIHPY